MAAKGRIARGEAIPAGGDLLRRPVGAELDDHVRPSAMHRGAVRGGSPDLGGFGGRRGDLRTESGERGRRFGRGGSHHRDRHRRGACLLGNGRLAPRIGRRRSRSDCLDRLGSERWRRSRFGDGRLSGRSGCRRRSRQTRIRLAQGKADRLALVDGRRRHSDERRDLVGRI